jgi:hypothetical protein
MAPEGAFGETLRAGIGRAAAFAVETSGKRDDAHARQAATGLYYAVATAVLASEGSRLAATGDARRLLLSALVLEHRLQPRDPLRPAAPEARFADLLLPETPVALSQVNQLVKK